ncbi:MAG: putative manganese-dependent inorganic diphosphatase [Lachnospiraceae bacterium]|nr:putative manganese-dependent inorganic diphosphatase [Lachnospiraceae bacterium]
MTTHTRKTYVIGHKNPDTDSVCSAIAYAYLKNQINHTDTFIPKCAGELNSETTFVLKEFGVPEPEFVADISTQVKDIEIRETAGVSGSLSLKKAYNLMQEAGVVTLPITEDEELKGLITINDIATSYMDAYDSEVIAKAGTPYKNIVDTLEAEMLVGDENGVFDTGKVLVAAASPDIMENYIEPHDLVIMGNRYEMQLCAIEMDAGCIVICENAPVSKTIMRLAEENHCTVLCTPYDTYTVARLINQSMPVEHFMTKEKIDIFRTTDFVDEIKEVMAKKRNRDFPILDSNGKYRGMISRRNLLDMQRRQVILVDHNEKTQAADGIENAEIIEIIDHHRLGTMETITPVFFRNQPLGCTATIVYHMFLEQGVEVTKTFAGLLCAAILSDTLFYRSPTCTNLDKEAAEKLAAIAGINTAEFANRMFLAASDLSNKSDEELLFNDFKKFNMEGRVMGVSQLSSVNQSELDQMKTRLKDKLGDVLKSQNLDYFLLMVTNIMEEQTELLYVGEDADSMLESAFDVKAENGAVALKGVVSRKKQLVPEILRLFQNT